MASSKPSSESVSDPALDVPSYAPPAAVVSNSDLQAVIDAAVAQALAKQAADAADASRPRVLSPEEHARMHLDNHGAGLGVDERLHQLYFLVELIAQKVGI